MSGTSNQRAFEKAFRHHQAGNLPEAEHLYRKILRNEPKHIDALHLLGVLSHQTGRLDPAFELIQRAIALRPNFPEAHNNLGNILKQKGQLDEAIAASRKAIALRPNYAEAHYNLGIALKEKGLLDDAIASYRAAVAARPDYAPAYYNLGNALKIKGQVDEAIAAYRKAIAHKLHVAEVYSNLATLLKEIGDLEGAIATYRQAMVINPNLAEGHSNFVYSLLFHPGFNSQAIAHELREWNRRHAQPLERRHSHPNDRDPNRPLRIGYVSPDLREHVVGQNLLPLFEQHDRQQFQITCYANTTKPDGVTTEFQKHADRWRNIVGQTDDQVARQIAEDRIDILVDLSLHMSGHRLLVFARKPAPVQVTFAGYPGSTGLTAIDYRLSDPHLDPPGTDESIHSERTIRLPDSFWVYDPLNGRNLPVNPLPALSNGFITFGCLNNFCKINNPLLSLWSSVLRSVDRSRFLLLTHEGIHRQRTLDQFSREGIDPKRIEFSPRLPRRDYLQLYHRIDLGLDSFPYNGHTTSLDSYWMGVPVVTLMGEPIVSRAGYCQLMNLNLPELVARTPQQFVQIAVDLARDLPRLRTLRGEIRDRMLRSPLMDAPRFARGIESAYRTMWREWCQLPR